jgi:hypothetical protein
MLNIRLPIIAVDWIALHLYIPKVQRSKLAPETGNPEISIGLLQSLLENSVGYFKLCYCSILPRPSKFADECMLISDAVSNLNGKVIDEY